MLSRSQIADRCTSICVEQLKCDPVMASNEAALLSEDLGADSLDNIELMLRCEEAFAIEVTDSEATGVRRLCDMIDLVVRKMA